MKKYKVYISNNGTKTLFHQGTLSKETWKLILSEIKSYFGWRHLTFDSRGDEIYIFNKDIIEQRRRKFFRSEVNAS